jgi:hypothetical protein
MHTHASTFVVVQQRVRATLHTTYQHSSIPIDRSIEYLVLGDHDHRSCLQDPGDPG